MPVAGPTLGGPYGFPPDSKPKCLFHYKGEVILEHTVRILRDCGINNIRIVVGYKREMIEQFNKERNLGLEVVYARGETCRDTLLAGLEGVIEDVLILFGDVWLSEVGLLTLLESKDRLIVGRAGHGFQLFQFGKEYLPKLRRVENRGKFWFLYYFCMVERGVEGFQCENNVYSGQRKLLEGSYLKLEGIRDIDWYWQTDEGIKAGAKRKKKVTS